MKRKVLVLTMGVICATQLWHSNHANALVTEGGANDTKQFTEIVSEESYKDAISKVNESFIYYPQNDLKKGLGGEHNDYEKLHIALLLIMF